ncbi:SpoIIE family protein phosphatase [Candidatus Viridilinea mediisalina]|uniref:HAMP domain-containing protein n=1 Tax=Candidatus Viridilinea mediisalina TaxID=2024553 RepID=A0A2A6RLB4_9CHLR|nr:SpoIIE family protein phosphatase [Candidatus Viridilinea mediisalina]PDW03679.1 hypothetical protein CJ255_07595 [Candidatus Viridilinea mediisalina]
MLFQARSRMSITDRLRWSYLVSSTLPLMLVGALLIGTLFQVQQRNALASQQALADQISGSIASFLYDIEQILLRAGRELQTDQSAADLLTAAQRLAVSSPDLRTITVLNGEGERIVWASSDQLVNQGPQPNSLPEALISAALNVGQGGRSSITTSVGGRPIFMVVIPIRDLQGNQIIGVLVAEVSAARIEQILRLTVQGTGKVAFLVDPQQQMLLNDGTLGWQAPRDLSPIFEQGTTVGRYIGGDDQQMIGARSPVAPVNAASWSVVVEQPTSELFVEVYRSVLLLAGLVALVGILALTWAFHQARRIVEPIGKLSAGANALAEGQLNHRIEVASVDELGHLATTFNAMAERLQKSQRKIEEQNERLRSGLALARDIQQGLLPAVPPWRSELLSIYGRSLPASEVGGDFYSYMALPDGRAAVAIGDISGKGVAAALLMALTSSTLESQAHFLDHPAAMLKALHEALRPRLQANHMNAAIMVAVFSADARSVTIANAGMIAPLLARRAPAEPVGCSFIEVGGLPIGTPLSSFYQEVTIPLAPGDTLILLSDGIVEAHNDLGQIYGFEQLEALVAALPPDLEVFEMVEQIIRSVLEFAGNAEPHDDITIIATRPVARMSLAVGDGPAADALAEVG